MYSWEIEEFIRNNNYILNSYNDFYNKIQKTSPQIKEIRREEDLSDRVKYYLNTEDELQISFYIKK